MPWLQALPPWDAAQVHPLPSTTTIQDTSVHLDCHQDPDHDTSSRGTQGVCPGSPSRAQLPPGPEPALIHTVTVGTCHVHAPMLVHSPRGHSHACAFHTPEPCAVLHRPRCAHITHPPGPVHPSFSNLSVHVSVGSKLSSRIGCLEALPQDRCSEGCSQLPEE